jgi:AraC-like DNA-binding protein
MDYLFIWLLGGRGYGETEGQRFEVVPGDLLTFVPGAPQSYGSDPDDPWDILWFHFEGQLADEFVAAIRAGRGPRLALGLDPELRDRWIGLIMTHSTKSPEAVLRCHTELYALLGLILYRLQRRVSVPDQTAQFDASHLQTYIHHHLTESLTLNRLAREVNLSVPHFVRLFKRQFKVSPIYYVIQKRIAHACSLLTETALPLKQISQAVGYDDPFYFSRMFKKMMGVNPTEYRRRQRLAAPR